MESNREYFDRVKTKLFVYVKHNNKYYVFKKSKGEHKAILNKVNRSKFDYSVLKLFTGVRYSILTKTNDLTDILGLCENSINKTLSFCDGKSIFVFNSVRKVKPAKLKPYNSYLYYLKKEKRLENLWQ